MSDVHATPSAEHPAGDEVPRTLRSSSMLDVSTGIVRLMKEHYGKGPTSVKAHQLGDAVVVLTHGGFTQAERTLADLGHAGAVIEQRRIFKVAMDARFRAVVSEATGREVVAVLHATHVAPDIGCETFILAPSDATAQD